MNIGVITLPTHGNYGGILQAWALQKVILSLGYCVTTFDFARPGKLPIKQKIVKYPCRAIRKFILRQPLHIDIEDRVHRHNQGLDKFIDNINRTIIRSIRDIDPERFDGLVFGSDQIWRAKYWQEAYGDVKNAFGAFVKNTDKTKLISYAASFGKDDIDEYNPKDIPLIAGLLKRFAEISVRENSAVEICRDWFGVVASRQIDPTLLHEKTVYESLCKEIPVSERLLTTYLLNPSGLSKDVIEKVRGMHNFVSSRELNRNIVEERFFSPEEWLASFRDAEFVVTDSFHGTVFAIIFGKPFVVVNNSDRGSSRFDTLLDLFGLQHHLVEDVTEIGSTDSYNHVEKTVPLLNKYRNESLSWLADSLQCCSQS